MGKLGQANIERILQILHNRFCIYGSCEPIRIISIGGEHTIVQLKLILS